MGESLAPFGCPFCRAGVSMLRTFPEYCIHLEKWHRGEGAFLCDLCRVAFRSFKLLEGHPCSAQLGLDLGRALGPVRS